MDFLKSGIKTVLGTSEPGQQQNVAEIVEKLVDRVSSSTLLEDRRDACRALKALSRKYRVEVGAHGMTALIQVLENDAQDSEIISYALDTLCHIMSSNEFDEEADNPTVTANVGEQFTEIFIKTPNNVTLVMSSLEEYEFRVRRAAIKLMTILITNKTKDLQEIILVSPMGVSKLMDLLTDSREVIRNDALLLLIQLTKSHSNIQKIVAFENAFDKLFEIVKDEGCACGGIVVEDCLILMLNLLKNNSSNQQFFKEGSFIQKLAPMLTISSESEEIRWTPQKVSNIYCMLQVVRALVTPSNQQQVIASCQKVMRSSNLLVYLCNVLMSSGVPVDTLTETINTVAEVVRGDSNNQEDLSKVMAPSNPPRPAIVVLLMSMVNEKQPLALRCAVLYCFQCFLYKNEVGQTSLIQTLLPSSTEVSTLTTGQLLCGGLFSADSLANWFSTIGLMHGLVDNNTQKEELLRVLLATAVGSDPVSLLEQCTNLLQKESYKLKSKVGLLMLLSMWLSHCVPAVKALISTQGTVAYLIAKVCANEHDENEYLVQGLCAFLLGLCIQFNDNSLPNNKREDICQLIIKRIGQETFCTKLSDVSRHEAYSRASKSPQIRAASTADLLLDYEYCRMYRSLEANIVKLINGFDANGTDLAELTLNSQASALVTQYKEIIRGLDIEINTIKEAMRHLEARNEELEKNLAQMRAGNAYLLDQNVLLRAQIAASGGQAPQPEEMEALKAENIHLRKELDTLNQRLSEEVQRSSSSTTELSKLQKDQDDLLELLSDLENKVTRYGGLLRAAGVQVEDEKDVKSDEEDQMGNV